jgi:hypothetical protein
MPNLITSNKCKRIYPACRKMDKYEQQNLKQKEAVLIKGRVFWLVGQKLHFITNSRYCCFPTICMGVDLLKKAKIKRGNQP